MFSKFDEDLTHTLRNMSRYTCPLAMIAQVDEDQEVIDFYSPEEGYIPPEGAEEEFTAPTWEATTTKKEASRLTSKPFADILDPQAHRPKIYAEYKDESLTLEAMRDLMGWRALIDDAIFHHAHKETWIDEDGQERSAISLIERDDATHLPQNAQHEWREWRDDETQELLLSLCQLAQTSEAITPGSSRVHVAHLIVNALANRLGNLDGPAIMELQDLHGPLLRDSPPAAKNPNPWPPKLS